MNHFQYINELPLKKNTGAQESIEHALLELYNEREIYKITVRELCQRASVARSTFYAYYNVIDECMLNIENRMIHEILKINVELKSNITTDNLDYDFLEKTIAYLKLNKKILHLFLIKKPNYRFIEKWKTAIKYHLYERFPASINEKNKELTLEILASETIATYQYWLENPYDIDVNYVKELIRRTLEAYTEQ